MKNNNGFTLIEIIISIAVIGLVITALFNINIAGWQFLNYNQDRVELQNQARLITTNLEKNIRNAIVAEPIYENKALAVITADNLDSNNIVFLVNINKQLIMGYIDKSLETIKGYSLSTIETNLYNKRNITNSVINSYNFEKKSNDKLISFNFELVKDKSRYKISNKFYPRVLN